MLRGIFSGKKDVKNATPEKFDITFDLDWCLTHTNSFATRENPDDFHKLSAALTELNVPATLVKAVYGIRYLYYIKPKNFADYDKLLKTKSQNTIAAAFGDRSVMVTWEGDCIVIDVPGAEDCTVRCADVLRKNEEYLTGESRLITGIGLQSDLTPVVMDLTKAPHVLIGGETGSGKSILMHDMIVGLLLNHTTEELQLYLVDPKRVEFAKYGKLKNVTLVNDVESAIDMLDWLCDEMDNRYKMLSKADCRDIESYNDKYPDKKMSRKVVFIDELSDLMSNNYKRQTEGYIVRIAQLARACGIHLVIATQRPDRTVVTGLIKDNIPVRICLSVSSNINSRIILDRVGGEKLTGKGDMLYLGNGMREPVRCHAGLITEKEIDAVVKRLVERQNGIVKGWNDVNKEVLEEYNK